MKTLELEMLFALNPEASSQLCPCSRGCEVRWAEEDSKTSSYSQNVPHAGQGVQEGLGVRFVRSSNEKPLAAHTVPASRSAADPERPGWHCASAWHHMTLAVRLWS